MREKCGRNAGENVEKMREKLPKKSHRKCGESYDKTLPGESGQKQFANKNKNSEVRWTGSERSNIAPLHD